MKREKQLPMTGLSKSSAEKQQSTNLLSKRALWSRLASGLEARTRFVDSNLGKHLAFQIRSMRDRENWSQEELARRVGMNQNAISRLENPFYGKPTLTTLKRLASVFDVGLIVRFAPFGELVDWVSGTPRLNTGLSIEALNVPSFEAETQSYDRSGEVGQGEPEYPDKVPYVATQLDLDLLPWNVRSMDDAIRKLRDKNPSLGQSNPGELGTVSDIKSQNAVGGLR